MSQLNRNTIVGTSIGGFLAIHIGKNEVPIQCGVGKILCPNTEGLRCVIHIVMRRIRQIHTHIHCVANTSKTSIANAIPQAITQHPTLRDKISIIFHVLHSSEDRWNSRRCQTCSSLNRSCQSCLFSCPRGRLVSTFPGTIDLVSLNSSTNWMHGTQVAVVSPNSRRATCNTDTRGVMTNITQQMHRTFTKCRKVSNLNNRIPKKRNLVPIIRMADVCGYVKIRIAFNSRIDHQNSLGINNTVEMLFNIVATTPPCRWRLHILHQVCLSELHYSVC